jgi:PAS domain S-box-containing protein
VANEYIFALRGHQTMTARPTAAQSAGRLFVILAGAIFAGETMVMLFLDRFPRVEGWNGALLDATMLSFMVAPVLFYFVFRPLTRHISERELAEQALRETDDAHRHILATTLDGFWTFDVGGRLLEVNTTYMRQSGYTREELLGMQLTDLQAPESALATAASLQHIITTGNGQFESIHRRKDGSLWHVEASASYLNTGKGQFFVFLRDITERKRAEADLHEHSELIAALSARMLNAQESEKQRIAFELHERVAQTLAAATFVVENAAYACNQDSSNVLPSLEAIIRPLQAATRDVRSVAVSLHPPTLDDLGLISALRALCREFGDKHQHIGLETSFDLNEEDIPEPLRAIIFRVAESALNVLAQSEAVGRVALSLRSDPHRIFLTLRDDALEAAPMTHVGLAAHPYIKARDQTLLSRGKFSAEPDPWGGIVLDAVWLR